VLREDFEKLYEKVYAKAVAVAGEDAVQEAALYFLERLDTNATITPSLFIQRAVQRQRNALAPRGVRHGGDEPAREVSVGSSFDLEQIEALNPSTECGRRVDPHPDADYQANHMK